MGKTEIGQYNRAISDSIFTSCQLATKSNPLDLCFCCIISNALFSVDVSWYKCTLQLINYSTINRISTEKSLPFLIDSTNLIFCLQQSMLEILIALVKNVYIAL